MRIYNCAIIGCGSIAGGYDRKIPGEWTLTHAGAYHLIPQTRLVAAADTSSSSLKAFGKKWKVAGLYTDYRKMLERENIDIVSLCLPTDKHFEAFKLACKKNIPAIFCEKPLAYDLKEAKEMAKLSAGRVVSVNYSRRWNPALKQLKKELDAGLHGEAINVVVRYTKGIFVNGSHFVDLLRWFLGEPKSISTIKIHTANAKDPGVDFALNFKNKTQAYFLHIPDDNFVFIDVDIITSKGRVVISQRGQRIERYAMVKEPHYKKINILIKTRDTETEWKNCTKRAIEEIVSCLKSGNKVSCAAEDGLKALEICNAVTKAK